MLILSRWAIYRDGEWPFEEPFKPRRVHEYPDYFWGFHAEIALPGGIELGRDNHGEHMIAYPGERGRIFGRTYPGILFYDPEVGVYVLPRGFCLQRLEDDVLRGLETISIELPEIAIKRAELVLDRNIGEVRFVTDAPQWEEGVPHVADYLLRVGPSWYWFPRHIADDVMAGLDKEEVG